MTSFWPPWNTPASMRPHKTFFAAVARLWQGVLQGDFTPAPQAETCEYCQLQGLCRAQVVGGLSAETEA